MKKSKFNELNFYIIFFTIFLIVSNFATSQMLRQETETGMMPVSSMLIPAGIQIALVFLIIWAVKRGGNSLKYIGFRSYSWWKDCLIGSGALVFLFFVVPWLHEFLVSIIRLSEVGVGKISFSAVWVISATAIGVAEEIIFRGYGYTILNKYVKRPLVCVLIVSAIFGAEHLYQGFAGAVQTFMIALFANSIFI